MTTICSSLSGSIVGHNSKTRDNVINKKPEDINIHETLNFVRLKRLMAIIAAATCKARDTYSEIIDNITYNTSSLNTASRA